MDMFPLQGEGQRKSKWKTGGPSASPLSALLRLAPCQALEELCLGGVHSLRSEGGEGVLFGFP